MDSPRLTLQSLQVLRVLLDDPTEQHYGLEIADATGLQSGTLYPILMRLERHGWVEGQWENIDPSRQGRPPRRYYRLTGVGQAAATDALASLGAPPPPGGRQPRRVVGGRFIPREA